MSSNATQRPTFENGDHIQRLRSADSIIMTPELFEKIYLQPENKTKGELRMTLGNPTPLALAALLITLTPLSCTLMGWRGAAGDGAATIGTLYFTGGLVVFLCAIGEFLLGNSFPLMVFGTYGSFFLAYGATLQPSFNAFGAFATGTNLAEGFTSVPFLVATGFWNLSMAMFSFVVVICAVRVNAFFVLIFICLTVALCFLSASNWYGALGDMVHFHEYRVVAGAFIFTDCILGWYLFVALALTTVDMPFSLPVGDLSTVVRSGTEKAKRRQALEREKEL